MSTAREEQIQQEYMQKAAQIGDLTLKMDATAAQIVALKDEVKKLNEEYSNLKATAPAPESKDGQ